jgi:mannose-6-phosphate isomerase-like protein (cupin superfamily)
VSADHLPGALDTPIPIAAAAAMRAEGLDPGAWENSPGYAYADHRHPYDKVLYCVRGSIRFDLTEEGRSVELAPGDRLDVPAGMAHSAVVGVSGVICLEAHT